MRVRAFLAVLMLLLVAVAPAYGAEAGKSTYRGWETHQLGNDLLKLEVLPEIGGRVIQYRLGDYEYFWINDQLAGTLPPPGGVGPNNAWLNYGGDKLWPAPQGFEGPHQWAGPPDPVLDTGAYTLEVLPGESGSAAVRLLSPKDEHSGIQYSRVVRVFDGTSRVSVEAAMENVSTRPVRWGVWSITQFNAASRHGGPFNDKLVSYTPLNANSKLHKGYKVIFGQVNNPSFQPDFDKGMMKVQYKRLIGKIGMDSSAGWTAVIDGADGYAFVQRFTFVPGKEYPDESSVEVWMDGVGDIWVGGEVWAGKDDPKITPLCMENELLGPFADLKPGERTTYHYDWYAAKIGGEYPALNANDVGIEVEPFTARAGAGGVALAGRFGVFHVGKAVLAFQDSAGKELGRNSTSVAVSPLEPLVCTALPKAAAPEGASTVVLLVEDKAGKTVGELGRSAIQR